MDLRDRCGRQRVAADTGLRANDVKWLCKSVPARVAGRIGDRAFDGTSEVDNPMQERTRILVPLVTFDVGITDRFGVQAAARSNRSG
jgi:hypothetical protein